jgi:hypothetical protein
MGFAESLRQIGEEELQAHRAASVRLATLPAIR